MTKFWKQNVYFNGFKLNWVAKLYRTPTCKAVTEKSPAEEEFNKLHLTEMGKFLSINS